MLDLLRATFSAWADARAPKMAAALAYYSAFAVAPLLVIAMAVAGIAFGEEAARGALVRQLQDLVGESGARVVQDLIQRAARPRETLVATALAVVGFLLASTGVFVELQDSLNAIWKVRKPPGRGILGTLRDRFLSFSMVLGIGFLLLVSLVASAALQAVGTWITGWAGESLLLLALNVLVSLGLGTLLFGAMFRFLPDARTRWRDVWLGAAVTALLFALGKFLIGLYLGRSTFGTTYGAAGSFVVFLIWVNYSAQIFFLGAQFTKTYADRHGARPRPRRGARLVACAPLEQKTARQSSSRRRGRRVRS